MRAKGSDGNSVSYSDVGSSVTHTRPSQPWPPPLLVRSTLPSRPRARTRMSRRGTNNKQHAKHMRMLAARGERRARCTSNGNGDDGDSDGVGDGAGSDAGVFTPSSYKIYFLPYHNNNTSSSSRRPRTSRTPKKNLLYVYVCACIRNTFAYTCVAQPKLRQQPSQHEVCQQNQQKERHERATHPHTYIHIYIRGMWSFERS